MDVVQTSVSIIQGIQVLIQGVEALTKAARDLREAPKRVANLEAVMVDLFGAYSTAKRSLSSRQHHPQVQSQLDSFETLLRELDPKIQRAKKLATRRKKGVKMYLGAIAVAFNGDELAELSASMDQQLVQWLRRHSLTSMISKSFSATAEEFCARLRVEDGLGYKPLPKAVRIRELLETSSRKVLLIHGLSGMGKSCLARHVAANPPERFLHGAVDIVLGQSCSRSAVGNNRDEYRKRLTAKLCLVLRALGRKKPELDGINVDDACYLLQESLRGKSILVLLDDVWESDIITRFTELCDNECKYLATTRNQSVYDEVTEADIVELGKEDVQDLSLSILMHHSQLCDDELPDVAHQLTESCGHHPLTLAVIGKALRGETRAEQWEKAMDELGTYAAQAPVPNRYMNEKEVETAATVFGSFDYSLNSMPPQAKELFTSLAALSWDGLVPETCLEALWTVLEQTTTFRLVFNRLLNGSLIRNKQDSLYCVHDMVALYLETKVQEGVSLLLKHSKPQARAGVVPWLCHFGNRIAQTAAEAALCEVFWSNDEDLPAVVLWNVVDVLSASSTMTELEASTVRFSRLIGAEVGRLYLLDSLDLLAAVTRCIAGCFTDADYESCTYVMIQAGATEKLATLLKVHLDPLVQRDAATVLARLAEYRHDSPEEMLKELPVKELVELLGSRSEGDDTYEEAIVHSIVRLAMAGEEAAVRAMFRAGLDKKLEQMLLQSEVSQQRAMLLLKSFHEAGASSLVQSFLRRPGVSERMPWQVRLNLERLVKKVPSKQVYNGTAFIADQVRQLDDANVQEGAKLSALQELASISEQMVDLVISAGLIDSLSRLLFQPGVSTRILSEACIILARISTLSGQRCLKPMFKAKTLEKLVTMATSLASSRDMQEMAYWCLRDIIFAGGRLVTEHLVKAGLVEKLVVLLDSSSVISPVSTSSSGSTTTPVDLGLQAVQDIVEVGGKECIQRLLSLHIVERLAALDCRGKPEAVVEFAKSVKRCTSLTVQERRVLSQQVLRQARTALSTNSPQLARLNKSASERGEGSGSGSGSGSGPGRRRSH